MERAVSGRRTKINTRTGRTSTRSIEEKNIGHGKYFDFTAFFIIVLLVLFGIIMIFSASYYYALTHPAFNDMYYFLKRQFLWAIVGFAAMIIMMNFDYHLLKRFSVMLYIFANICLILVKLFGKEVYGAKRWLELGPIKFQPSEVAKIAVILILATFISNNRGILKTFKGFMICSSIAVLPIALIAIENMSTAIVAAAIGFGIIFVASPKIWYFVLMATPAVAAMAGMIVMPGAAFRLTRVKTWLDPFADVTDAGFQTVQSLYAVGSGGLFGLGLGQSRQKLGYIPEAHNDIIFSIICEELGLFGATIVLGLFMILIWRFIKISMNASDLFGSLIATGAVILIGIQVVINIAVVTNTMPVTGMPLPFISYGGTSLCILLTLMGIVLNISKFSK